MADDQERLGDEAVVVRFGAMDIASLKRAASLFKEERGIYGLSAYGDNGLTVSQTALQARRPHKKLRATTVGRLRKAGFVVQRTGKWPHLTITSGRHSEDVALEELVSLFDDPIANPHPVGRS